MKNLYSNIVCALLLCVTGVALAQQPSIEQVDKRKAGLREMVSIKGSGFGNSAAQVQVWFGAAKGRILSVADQLLEVETPGGATYEDIYVVRTNSGLSATTPASFLYSFGGEQGIDASNFSSQTDFQSNIGLNDLCLCDFNADGKTDIIAPSRGTSLSFDLFRNQSTPATLAFSKTTLNLAARSRHATCGDLNGDGFPDLVLTEDGDDLYFFKNNTTGGFSPRQSINFAGREPKRIEIADLDLDGKPDLVITDQKVVTGGPATIILLKNQSTLTTISFAAPQLISIANAESTDALDVADLDADGFPDIVVSQFNTSNSNLFVLKNTSSTGSLSLAEPLRLTISGNVVNVRLGDLDGDNRADIAATQLLGSGFTVFRNTSEANTLQFASGNYFVTDVGPSGIDFGDLDGDGKTDVAIASLRTDVIPKSVTVLSNTSSVGAFGFERVILPTTFINRQIRIGDLDNDGKPDLAFASVDDVQTGVSASKISIMRNQSCVTPKISPEGPHTICSGFSLELKSSETENVSYQWQRNGVDLTGETQENIIASLDGSYTVTLTGENGTCIKTSQPVDVEVISATSIDPVVPGNNGPVCLGDDLVLSANAVSGATQYQWKGPEGFSSALITPGQDVTVPNFSVAKSGRYELNVFIEDCLAQQVSTRVEAISIPDFSISAGASVLFCEGDTKTLTISPNVSNFTYKWFKEGAEISGATTLAFVASETGNYSAEITSTLNPGCQPDETNTVSLIEVTRPTAAFTVQPEACTNQLVAFTNQSTQVDTRTSVFYTWMFGDAATSTSENPEHSYATTGSKSVVLSVSYANSLCLDTETKSILITPSPTISITNADNRFAICPGETIELGVSGGPYQTYEWSTNETTPTITRGVAGIVGVTVKTNIGCVVGSNRTIEQLPEPEVTVVATPEEISRGTSTQLTASGLENYSWLPVETLSDAGVPNPIASPIETTTYTVVGTDSNGCAGEGSVEVRIKGENIVDLLTPSNSFSPNGDGRNETWTVGNIENFGECGVTVYDEKGVKVFESKPYANTWDGTANGKQLPQGVYYFIIRCEGQENQPRTGSITLLR